VKALEVRIRKARKGDVDRIIDIERALPLRPYAAEGKIVLEVVDDFCPWNAGRWALSKLTG